MRVAYVKVAEYQQRGLVHLHVVIRLDRAMPAYRAETVRAAGAAFTVELLEDALRAAAAAVTRSRCRTRLGGGYVTWGAQLDVQHIGAAAALEAGRCAGYLAKYATKATELAGGVLHRVTEHELDELPVREHVATYLRHAFALDAASSPTAGSARNAHAFGYRGHCLTKSRRYSTTFKQLRAEPRAARPRADSSRARATTSQRAIAAAAPDGVAASSSSSARATHSRRGASWPHQRPRARAREAPCRPRRAMRATTNPKGARCKTAAMTAANTDEFEPFLTAREVAEPLADRAMHGAAVLRRGRAARACGCASVRGGRCGSAGARWRRR